MIESVHVRRQPLMCWFLMLFFIAIIGPIVRADVSLPSIISDHMVLQAGEEVRIWGWALPGEVVTVTLAGQTQRAVADAHRRWQVALPAMEPGGPHILEIQGNNRLQVKDVLIGQVWLCAGQSNMAMQVADALNPREETRNAADQELRFFTLEQTAVQEMQENVAGRWVVATPQTVADFSATGYFFGRELRRELKQPVGLINASWGGTLIESWMALRSMNTNPRFENIMNRLERAEEMMPAFMAKYQEQMEAWEQAVIRAEDEGREMPREPWVPKNFRAKRFASYLFNGMIHPIINYRIAGVLWYQGESNAVRGAQYHHLLTTMIDDWRRRWQQPLPFIVVQAANYMSRRNSPNSPSAWAELRESQFLAAKQRRNVGLIVTIDIGEEMNIHPRNKQDVGYRASLWALKHVYDREDLVASGPTYRSNRRMGRRLLVSFRDVGDGLVTRDNQPLRGFAIAGEDRNFFWAKAEIQDNNQVLVWSEIVKEPVAVRYNWANNPAGNLYNAEGLPASPFRSDDWPGVTTGKE